MRQHPTEAETIAYIIGNIGVAVGLITLTTMLFRWVLAAMG